MTFLYKQRFFRRSILLTKLYNFWINYVSPANFSYWWNFGSMALVCLILQIITGIFLAMHYKSDFLLAFQTIEYISRNIQNGWLLRYFHANGASIFFVVVYLHILRSLMFGSYTYPRTLLWLTGIIIFILMIVTAFFGYVLPWGQMSFWAATVITSLFTAIPYIGNEMVLWLWGGYSVNDATLNRFFSFHFFLPFILLALSIIHIMLLHEFGSNHPLGIYFRTDGFAMAPYYIIKDLFGINMMLIFLAYLIFLVPNLLGHPDNYILANQLVTPTHIVPEWYFLPLYAISRSVPDKLMGIIALAFAFIGLFLLPFIFGLLNIIRSFFYKPYMKVIILIFIINSCFLGWIGGMPVIEPYFSIGQFVTVIFFVLLFIIGICGFIEQFIYRSYILY